MSQQLRVALLALFCSMMLAGCPEGAQYASPDPDEPPVIVIKKVK